ncbi:MAG: hypothetical protein ACPL6C_02090 [bacterium]
MSDYITIGDFLKQTFKRWWEIQKELGRIRKVRIVVDGKVDEVQCFIGSFSLRERESLGNIIPVDASKASFTVPVDKNSSIEVDGKIYSPTPIAEIPWGEIKEYVVALVPEKGGEK